MIINPNATLFNTIVFYVLSIVAIMIIKPNLVYCHKQKRFRDFGYGEDKTIFALPVVGISLAILIYFIFFSIETMSQISPSGVAAPVAHPELPLPRYPQYQTQFPVFRH